MDKHRDALKISIEMSLKVIQHHRWLMDLYVVDFFTENHWELLPLAWRECFCDIDPQTLGYIIRDLPTNHILPLSFLALMKVIKSLSFPRQSVNRVESNEKQSVIGSHPKLKNLFLKHVKLKKRHEISLMANVVHSVAVESCCDAVIDFGSGLGHLVRMLSYKYDLHTVGIEGQNQLTDEARKLDSELEYTAQKYVDAETMRKLNRPIHCNKTLNSPSQLEKLSFSISNHGLIGLHPCGDLGPLLLKYFVSCERSKFICLVGCCYMKLTCENGIGYPMSKYLQSLDYTLSYPSREIACHAIEVYCEKLCKGDYNDLKVHAFRAALERILVAHNPKLRHSPIRSVKHTENMTFENYCKIALERMSLPGMDTSQAEADLSQWKRVIIVYTLRLLLAPLVETLILLDRLYYLTEHGIYCEIHPVFDPRVSPRNHVIIGRKI
ncbi:methyltransferase-like protein 25B isoform X1 [Leptidea sinapis]|uniref:methyltransferase-like protein 25B isoform X1 n=3 Tax=Leptidea sinapis TaxID=189913 RepID=UPI0021C2B25F|nr:methyltransferase-like protein 25B isoform X1 [Leptidea sinapis]